MSLTDQVLKHPSGIYLLAERGDAPGSYDVTEYVLVESAGSIAVRIEARHEGVASGYLEKFKPAPRPVAEAVLDHAAYRRAYDRAYADLSRGMDAENMCDVVRRCHEAAGEARAARRQSQAPA